MEIRRPRGVYIYIYIRRNVPEGFKPLLITLSRRISAPRPTPLLFSRLAPPLGTPIVGKRVVVVVLYSLRSVIVRGTEKNTKKNPRTRPALIRHHREMTELDAPPTIIDSRVGTVLKNGPLLPK